MEDPKTQAAVKESFTYVCIFIARYGNLQKNLDYNSLL